MQLLEVPLKRSVDGCVNGFWGGEPNEDENDTIVIRVADFERAKLSLKDEGYTYRRIEDKEKVRRLLKFGDLLLEKSGGGEKTLVGQVVLFDKNFEAITSNFVAKMTPNSGFDGRFLNYVFSRLYGDRINYCSIKQNTGIQNLDSDSYLAEKVGFPAFEEQQKIAQFLDHETAKIDTLIEKQQRLIELLKEKRQAVISHAVTKGLNPNAPMKDSGVEWLGEVPEHWEVKRLKDVLSEPVKNGLFKKKEQFGTGSFLVNVGDLYADNYFINLETLERVITTPDERKMYKVEAGDIFFVRSSLKLEGIGRSACFLENHDDVVFECHIVNARPNKQLMSSKYLTRYLNSLPVSQEFVSRSKTTTMTTIDQSNLVTINVVVPPKKEQLEIDDYLDKQISKIEKAENYALDSIDLLKERRTALISAAVTGKIDVRNWGNL